MLRVRKIGEGIYEIEVLGAGMPPKLWRKTVGQMTPALANAVSTLILIQRDVPGQVRQLGKDEWEIEESYLVGFDSSNDKDD